MTDLAILFLIQAVAFAAIIVIQIISMVNNYRERKRKNYSCKHCGWTKPKIDVKISGFSDSLLGIHAHCGNCGAIVASNIEC